jgi:hypothetical protein
MTFSTRLIVELHIFPIFFCVLRQCAFVENVVRCAPVSALVKLFQPCSS